jgi:hypothetical protein
MTTSLTRPEIYAAFKKMRIMHPRIENIIRVCDGARRAARANDDEEPQGWIELFAASHSGKSHAVKMYIERSVVPELIAEGVFPADMSPAVIARRQVRAMHVTLRERATRESLYADILVRLGAQVKGTEKLDTLRRQLYLYLRGENDPINNPHKKRPCELLILDEIQHLSQGILRQMQGKRTKDLESSSTDVADALKFMMIEGLVPVMFVGIPEARVHLQFDRQLPNRHIEEIDFSPLRWSSAGDAKIFTDFCGKIGIKVQNHGLLANVSNLLVGEIPHMLWAASGGLIGLASRIVEEAVYHAQQAGKEELTLDELALAVDTRAIPQGYCLYNPFREGVISSAKGRT